MLVKNPFSKLQDDFNFHCTAQVGNLTIHEATDRNLKFAVGNLFDCTPDNIGLFDAVWDCNSFGAISPQERNKYVEKISSLTRPQARVLLSAYEYMTSLCAQKLRTP